MDSGVEWDNDPLLLPRKAFRDDACNSLSCAQQGAVRKMAVPCRDTWNRMTEQASDRQLRITEFRGDAREAVPQGVKCHALDLGSRADPRQNLRDADRMAGTD